MRESLALLALLLLGRASGQTFVQPQVCARWSGSVAVAQGRAYYYGGEATLSPAQTSGRWTNALLSLALNTSFSLGRPPLVLVTPDSGNYSSPPAVALGALWPSLDEKLLFTYGGELSDSPSVPPPAQATFQFDISRGVWSVAGTSGVVTRAAEGASAYGSGVGYYFSGHLDSHTVQGWSNQIDRVYLNSLLTFDTRSLSFNNITSYPSTSSVSNTSLPETVPLYRADGTLTYVPGMGTGGKGILVAIGGATATQYVDNSLLDVFDVGSGGWSKQPTLGFPIGSRVSHCSVLASDPATSTSQIFVYGGQALNQTARDSALYILSLPSFTWTQISSSTSPLPSEPTGRAGHQCVLDGSQLVSIGGYVSEALLCDQPGIYVYDVSKGGWQTAFTAGTAYTVPALISSAAGSPSGSSPNVGAIAGGVVGGLLALLLILGLLLLRRRRKRAAQAQLGFSVTSRRSSGPARKDSGEGSNEDEKRGPSPYGAYRRQSGIPASDDVENETRDMEAAFGGSHLVPKQTLRVTNPENDE